MAKKIKRSVHNASVLFANKTETKKAHDNSLNNESGGQQAVSRKSFRSGLSGGRIGVIAAILFITLGAFGVGSKYLEDSAKRQASQQAPTAERKNSSSYLSTLNSFVTDPPPAPTPQLSKEYIYAGSRMLAVEDANASAAPPADLAVWRPSTGVWHVLSGQGSQSTAFSWGGTFNGIPDVPVPGDYDGDGRTDFSVFRPGNGIWYVSNSSNGGTTERSFGTGTDKPAAADYDGDGRTDMAVYRPSEGKWYINPSSNPNPTAYTTYVYGGPGDVPTPADFDGDGRADIAYWHNLTGQTIAEFYVYTSTSNYVSGFVINFPFSSLNDKPVVGDYDGDGRADAAVWRKAAPYQYQWHVRYSSTQTIVAVTSLGDPDSDIAVQNDYDGDGKTDMAMWRPSTGMWHIQQSSNGQARNVQWGQSGDVPVPVFYRR